MTLLENYGWNDFHKKNYNAIHAQGQLPGRVISVRGFKYYLITQNGEIETELSGKLLYGTDTEDLPKVGDWVCYLDYGQTGYIIDVLPRENTLSRKNPGNKIEKQILATNIDHALIVQGLDGNFNIMRLERYIVQVIACGIVPIIVLNKADLINDHEPVKSEIAKLQRACKVLLCSTVTGYGVSELKATVQKFKTYILMGSSGVGKSSLLNLLMEKSAQETGEVSEANSKGKHTTTTRDLFQLPHGALLIDTPGMREFGLTFEEGSEGEMLFPAIEEFAVKCRYTDCKHVDEPGCAVIDAVQAGNLSDEVYDSYLKLIKEQKRFQIRIEDKKRLGKQSGKMSKEARDHRKKYKF
jgi:ribosome biogenesis GTPase / thiamine phosphate phosphatase